MNIVVNCQGVACFGCGKYGVSSTYLTTGHCANSALHWLPLVSKINFSICTQQYYCNHASRGGFGTNGVEKFDPSTGRFITWYGTYLPFINSFFFRYNPTSYTLFYLFICPNQCSVPVSLYFRIIPSYLHLMHNGYLRAFNF